MEVQSRPPRELNFTDWDLLRKIRVQGGKNRESRDSFDPWVAQLKEDVAAATKSIVTDLRVDRMDSRLAHLLEAKNALLLRWKAQKLNRRLREKIAVLNREIEGTLSDGL
ncbi:hypothetical protein MTO96_051271 [Rhipicephalus appendiculatus]